jgi:Flp pilus assembly pilin Flp
MVRLLMLKNALAEGVKKFCTKKEEGASMAEYAVLLAIVTAAVMTSVTLLGTNIKTVINTVAGRITVS